VETVEYFLLPLPAPYKVSRFRVCFRFQLLTSKCFRFHKNLTASASTSLPHVLWKMHPIPAPQNVKCFRVHFQLLSSKCFRFHIPVLNIKLQSHTMKALQSLQEKRSLRYCNYVIEAFQYIAIYTMK